MGGIQGGELSEGSYLTITNITDTSPSDLGIHQTYLSIVLSHDQESGNPRVYQESHTITRVPLIPTLELPGNMNRNAYYEAFHEWIHSSLHLDIPLDDDFLWEFTFQVIDSVFERLDDLLHQNVAMCVSADLHRAPATIEKDDEEDEPVEDDEEEDDPMEDEEEYDPVEDVDEEYDPIEDDNGDESLMIKPAAWVQALSDSHAVVAVEEHRKLGDCLICLDPLFSSDEEGNKKYLFRSKCGHYFHGQCMSEWLTRSDSCPMCRFDISSLIQQ